MSLRNSLSLLSPLDGRYGNKTQEVAEIFSEKSLIWHRLYVEVFWLKHLSHLDDIPECPTMPPETLKALDLLLERFSEHDAAEIKAIEIKIAHDVKAIEVYLAQQDLPGFAPYKPWIHFACTSEDINNLAYALMLKKAKTCLLEKRCVALLKSLTHHAHTHIDDAMLAKTHGQPATPTTLGREMAVYMHRLAVACIALHQTDILGKFNGATGGMSAHYFAYPNHNWLHTSRQFVASLGLSWNPLTTQIEPHDYIARMLNRLTEINTILIDLSTDIWQYISQRYFVLEKNNTHQVGSSTMPHKINPIQFENAEGNLGLGNALNQHMAVKLTQSRLQRDLSDSTVLRNLGCTFGYTDIACQQLITGLAKIKGDSTIMLDELNQHWEVLGEAIQTILRKHGHIDAYDSIKKHTQGENMTQESYQQLVATLKIPQTSQHALSVLEPKLYVGQPKLFLAEAMVACNIFLSTVSHDEAN